MQNEMTLQKSSVAAQMAAWVRNYYEHVLGRELSTRQTLALVEAQLAFFMGVLPAGYALATRMAALLWLACAVKRCRRLLD